MKEYPDILMTNLMRNAETPRRFIRRLPQDLCSWLDCNSNIIISNIIIIKIYTIPYLIEIMESLIKILKDIFNHYSY
jgi:hypothetical protein